MLAIPHVASAQSLSDQILADCFSKTPLGPFPLPSNPCDPRADISVEAFSQPGFGLSPNGLPGIDGNFGLNPQRPTTPGSSAGISRQGGILQSGKP